LADTAAGGVDRLYVALRDSSNHTGGVVHPDPEIVKATMWVPWEIALKDFADAGVNLSAVKMMTIGVGDPDNPVAGGSGIVFVDDILLTAPASAAE